MTTTRLRTFWMACALGATAALGATGCELITAVDRDKIAAPPIEAGTAVDAEASAPVTPVDGEAADDAETSDGALDDGSDATNGQGDAPTSDAGVDPNAPDAARLDAAAEASAPADSGDAAVDVTSPIDASVDAALEAVAPAPDVAAPDVAVDAPPDVFDLLDGGDAAD